MAFAQFTYRESLRDIEACLRSMNGKLYHMGFRSRIARSTLADANETHDWRIFADFAQHLIGVPDRFRPATPWAWISITASTRSTRPPSICVFRCSRGPGSAPAKAG